MVTLKMIQDFVIRDIGVGCAGHKMAQKLHRTHHKGRIVLRCLTIGQEMNFRGKRRFIRIGNTCEVFYFAFERTRIKIFGVAFNQYVLRGHRKKISTKFGNMARTSSRTAR